MTTENERPCKHCKLPGNEQEHYRGRIGTIGIYLWCTNSCESPVYEPMDNLEYLVWKHETKQAK